MPFFHIPAITVREIPTYLLYKQILERSSKSQQPKPHQKIKVHSTQHTLHHMYNKDKFIQK